MYVAVKSGSSGVLEPEHEALGGHPLRGLTIS